MSVLTRDEKAEPKPATTKQTLRHERGQGEIKTKPKKKFHAIAITFCDYVNNHGAEKRKTRM